LLGEAGCKAVVAVAMHMNTAFDLEEQQRCPQAGVAYDLFHVAARFGREVVDRIRVDQAQCIARPTIREAWSCAALTVNTGWIA